MAYEGANSGAIGSYEGFGGIASQIGGTVAESAGGKAVAGLYDSATAMAKYGQDASQRLSAVPGLAILSQEQKKAYQYFYSQTRHIVEQVQNNPALRNVLNVGQGMLKTAEATQSLISRVKGGFHDASGVADVAKLTHGAIKSMGQIAMSLGIDKTVVGEIVEWAGIASGCAVGIAGAAAAGAGAGGVGSVVGAAGGAIGCAFSAIAKFFAGEPKPVTPTAKESAAMALFVPNVQQQPFIVRDAVRLAAVLRHYYGIRSYEEIARRLEEPAAVTTYTRDGQTYQRLIYRSAMLVKYPHAGNYPKQPAVGTDGKLATAEAPPGFTGYDLGVAMSLEATNRNEVSRSLAICPDEQFFTGKYAAMRGVRGRTAQIKSFIDVMGQDAWVSRAPGENDAWRLQYRISQDGDANVEQWQIARDFYVAWMAAGLNPGNESMWPEHRVAVRVDELLELFAAITKVEIIQGQASVQAFGGTALPVRNFWASDDRREKVAGGTYSKNCWTSGYAGGLRTCGDIMRATESARIRKEMAYIRLRAAFSYMNMMYAWFGEDMIFDVKPSVSSLAMPEDPRQAIGNLPGKPAFTGLESHGGERLAFRIIDKERRLAPAIAAAQRDAQNDYLSVAPAAVQQILRPVGPLAVVASTVLSRPDRYQIMTKDQWDQWCRAKGLVPSGAWPKKQCVPPSEASKLGPVVLLGGAALAALLLLR